MLLLRLVRNQLSKVVFEPDAHALVHFAADTHRRRAFDDFIFWKNELFGKGCINEGRILLLLFLSLLYFDRVLLLGCKSKKVTS